MTDPLPIGLQRDVEQVQGAIRRIAEEAEAAVPGVEWWDAVILDKVAGYGGAAAGGDATLRAERITHCVEHPLSLDEGFVDANQPDADNPPAPVAPFAAVPLAVPLAVPPAAAAPVPAAPEPLGACLRNVTTEEEAQAAVLSLKKHSAMALGCGTFQSQPQRAGMVHGACPAAACSMGLTRLSATAPSPAVGKLDRESGRDVFVVAARAADLTFLFDLHGAGAQRAALVATCARCWRTRACSK